MKKLVCINEKSDPAGKGISKSIEIVVFRKPL